MNKKTFPEWLFTLLAIAAACVISLFLRIALPYQSVFDGQWVKLTGVDAYFYMRLVDNLLHNFPHLFAFDPYWVFPGGFYTAGYPSFFAYLLAGTVKLLGGVSPSQQTVDSIAVYVPAVLGALAVIPVYFIGRALMNRWAGLAAALIAALMPGELLSLTLLGNTDHHAAEILLTACFSACFMLSLKHGRQFTYATMVKGWLPAAGRNMPYAIAAGIFMGLYLITWSGALLFVFIAFIYFVLQFISDHIRGFPTDYLSKTAITCYLIALLIFLPVSSDKLTLLALAGIILASIALNVTSNTLNSRNIRPAWFLAVVAGLAALAMVAVWLFFPAELQTGVNYFNSMFAWRTGQSVVGEMKSLLFPGGTFTLEAAWSQYALALYTGLAGLITLIFRCVHRGEPEHIFAAVWSIVMLAAAFAMLRFGTYFAVCLAVLTGYLAGRAVEIFMPAEGTEEAEHLSKKAKKRASARKTPLRRIFAGAAVCVVVAALLVPGTAGAIGLASRPGHTPSNAWMEALTWMREKTPEPLGTPDAYYKDYNAPAPGKAFAYPATAYGVVAWSDYGYWVSRVAHRIPTTNPGLYPVDEAKYFTAQDEAATLDGMRAWKAKYVVVDSAIASPNDKFYALANLSGKTEADFYELCWQKNEAGTYLPLLVFYPEFYRTMLVRLYNFDARQVVPSSAVVMSYQDRLTADRQKFREITSLKSFKSTGDAEAFIKAQKEGTYKIVGTDPLSSPVPLDALDNYKLVYGSTEKASAGSSPLPAVKVFEYSPGN